MTILIPPRAPNLPLATPEYVRAYQDQYSNALRLYFNQMDNTNAALLGPAGGRYVDCPFGLFFNTDPQALTVAGTAYAVELPTPYLSNHVALKAGSTTKVEAAIGGVYNFQLSCQLLSNSASAKTMYLWIIRNGTTIGYSTRAYTLTLNNEYFEVNWSFNIDLLAGQYIEMMAAADATGLTLHAAAAAAPHPGIPSSVLSVNFIAPLPQVLPTPP